MRALLKPALLLSAAALVLGGCGGSSQPSAKPAPAAPQASSGGANAGAAPAAAQAADVTTIARRNDVPVLCFHQIRDWRPSDSASDRGIITPLADFARQMDFLASQGYHPISDEALYQHLVFGAPVPPKAVLLSFDDGSEVQYKNAFPVLRKHGFTATFFPMTIVLNKPQWMTTAQLREMDAAGMTIASHTYDHAPVTKYNPAAVQTELVQSREELSKIVGHPVVDFAYPYGSWKHASLALVKNAGYRMAFGLDTPLDPSDPLHSLPRVIVAPTWSDAKFASAIATAPHPTANLAQAGEG